MTLRASRGRPPWEGPGPPPRLGARSARRACAAAAAAGLRCAAAQAARPSGRCAGPALSGCLGDLAGAGLGALGASRELVQTCGDENPPLEFLAHPDWLPEGATRRLLLAGLAAEHTRAFALLAEAFAALRAHAETAWLLALSVAHQCLEGACDAVAAAPAAAEELRRSRARLLREAAALVQRSLATGDGGASDAAWVAGLGDVAQIVARHAFAAAHLDLAAAAADGLGLVPPLDAATVLHGLSTRVAVANCEMLAQLIAHFTLTSLWPAIAAASQGSLSALAAPRVEFLAGACCRRWNVLSHLIQEAASSRGDAPFRIVEVGVNNALTAEYLLGRFPMLDYDGVDPYIDAEAIHEEASRRLARFGGRARLWRGLSEPAAGRFAPGSLDLVFVDGDHSFEGVTADLRAWSSRVRPGGLLAGHDLFNPAFDGVLSALVLHLNATGDPGVRPAAVHFGPDFVWWLPVE